MNCVQVLYFAGIADITKVSSEQIQLTSSSSLGCVQDVVGVLETKYGPEFTKIVDTCMFAVDMEYVSRTHSLHAGQEMAIIPPVSGG